MRNIRAARRYARAVFQIAAERGTVEATYGDLETACARVAQYPEIGQILAQPFFRDELKQKACDVALKGSVSQLVLDFVHLLVANDRGDLLEAVRDAFRALWHDHENVCIAEVTSAVSLTPEEVTRLAGEFGTVTGCRVEVEQHVDPALLGGVVVVVGDTVWDGSVRGGLERMRSELKSRDVVGMLRERLSADAPGGLGAQG
jgi:F-type H+-transporting ATPase subunit delta